MKKLLTAGLLIATAVAAEGYKVLNKIKIGGTGGWDYVALDNTNRRLYASHATTVEELRAEGWAGAGKAGVEPATGEKPAKAAPIAPGAPGDAANPGVETKPPAPKNGKAAEPKDETSQQLPGGGSLQLVCAPPTAQVIPTMFA